MPTATAEKSDVSIRVIADHAAGDHLPDRRRGHPEQRGPGLRAAPHHAPGRPPRLHARNPPRFPPPWRGGAGRLHGRRLSRVARARRLHRPHGPTGGGALPRHPRGGAAADQPGGGRCPGQGARANSPATSSSACTTPTASRSTWPSDMAGDEGLALDMAGFERLMEEQRTRARASWVGSGEEGVAAAWKQAPGEAAADPLQRLRAGAGARLRCWPSSPARPGRQRLPRGPRWTWSWTPPPSTASRADRWATPASSPARGCGCG